MKHRQIQRPLGLMAAPAVAALFLFHWGHRGPPSRGDWLGVSRPMLTNDACSPDPAHKLTVVVTNLGRSAVSVSLAWFEFRTAPSEVPLFSSEDSPVPTFELLPGDFTNLTWTLRVPPSSDPLFCGMLHWWEAAAPALTRAFRGSTHLADIARMIDDIHVFDAAPWHWRHKSRGTAFASSAGVEDYFSRAYGWRYESLAREQAELQLVAQQNKPTVRYGVGLTPMESAREKAQSVLLSWHASRE